MNLYLEAMVGKLRRLVLVLGCALSLVGVSSTVFAQDQVNDAAGREYFERGRAAFEEADYENALAYFRHAYELSGRAELQYNVGVAADRLQREEEALEAFRRYLVETVEPSREAEVRQRIDALERTIAQREVTELALEEAALRYDASSDEGGGTRLPKATIAGATTLAAVGAAGVVAMGIGLAKDGTCSQAVAGNCVTQHSVTPWTYVYGALGVAALAGSAAWFGISAKRAKSQRETQLTLGPTGLVVSGTF